MFGPAFYVAAVITTQIEKQARQEKAVLQPSIDEARGANIEAQNTLYRLSITPWRESRRTGILNDLCNFHD